MNKIYLYVGIAVVLILAGLAIGWKFFAPDLQKPEIYAPLSVQDDGSKVLERKPQHDAKPAHKIPDGAKVERIVEIEVRSLPEKAPSALQEGSSSTGAPSKADCPPVKVDLSLVRLPDESRRVIASSSNGEIVGGVDIPVESARVYKELKWAAGVSYNPLDRGFGAFIDRDLGPFRLGAEVNQIKDGFDTRLKAGMRF